MYFLSDLKSSPEQGMIISTSPGPVETVCCLDLQAVKLIAIASRTSNKLEEFGNKYQIKNEFRFNDYDALLENENIDAVYIATPHVFHADLSIRAAGKGKHILCEKPGAVNFSEALKVIEKVKAAGVFYKEGFMYRCHPQIPALINIIKKGEK